MDYIKQKEIREFYLHFPNKNDIYVLFHNYSNIYMILLFMLVSFSTRVLKEQLNSTLTNILGYSRKKKSEMMNMEMTRNFMVVVGFYDFHPFEHND